MSTDRIKSADPSLAALRRQAYHDRLAAEFHAIAFEQLLALLRFQSAIHQYAFFGNHLLGLASARSEPAEFQELTQLNRHIAHHHITSRFVIRSRRRSHPTNETRVPANASGETPRRPHTLHVPVVIQPWL